MDLLSGRSNYNGNPFLRHRLHQSKAVAPPEINAVQLQPCMRELRHEIDGWRRLRICFTHDTLILRS